MPPSVYQISQVFGESTESWEASAKDAVRTALEKVPGARAGEIVRQELMIDEHSLVSYRTHVCIAYTEQ